MDPYAPRRVTLAEYLAFDRDSEMRYEYVNGIMYPVGHPPPPPPDAPLVEAALIVNLVAALHAQLRGGPGRVFTYPVKVTDCPGGRYAEPDVLVVRAAPVADPAYPDTVLKPGGDLRGGRPVHRGR